MNLSIRLVLIFFLVFSASLFGSRAYSQEVPEELPQEEPEVLTSDSLEISPVDSTLIVDEMPTSEIDTTATLESLDVTETIPEETLTEFQPIRGVLMDPEMMSKWEGFLEIDSPSTEVSWLIEHGEEILDESDKYYAQIPANLRSSGEHSKTVVYRMKGAFENVVRNIELELANQLSLDELRGILDDYKKKREQLETEVSVKRRDLIAKAEYFLEVESNNQKSSVSENTRIQVISEVIYRLADLYYLESEEQFVQELLDYEVLLSNLEPGEAEPVEPTPDYSKSIAMYRSLIEEYPNTPYVPDALYNIAVILGVSDTDQATRQAKDTFEALVDNYPQSPYAAEALYRIGDYHFIKKSSPEDAIPYFERVLSYPESEQYVDALYMLGWCNFFLGQEENYYLAVDYFDQTIKYAWKKQNERGKSTGDLIDEAVRYSAITFALDPSEWQGGGVDNMVTYVESDSARKEIYGYDLLRDMGGILSNDYKDETGAISAFHEALDIYPTHRDNPWLHNDIITLYWDNLQDEEATYIQRQEMFDRYRRGSVWDEANQDPQLRADADTLINKYYYDNFLIAANQVAQTKSSESVEEALKVTQNYLVEFPLTEKTPYVQYTMAALLEDSYKYDPQVQYLADAFEAYADVVTRWGDNEYRLNAGQRLFDIAQNLVAMETAGQEIPDPTFHLGEGGGERLYFEADEAPQVEEVQAEAPPTDLIPPETEQETAEILEDESPEAPVEDIEDIETNDSGEIIEEETPVEDIIPEESETTEPELLEESPEDEVETDTTSTEQGFIDIEKIFRDTFLEERSSDWDALENAWVQDGMMDVPPVDTSAENQPENAVKADDEDIPKEIPLLKSEKMLMYAIDTYSENFPDHKLTPDMLYKGGMLLHEKKKFDASRKYFEKIISDYQDSRHYENSWLAVLEGYYETKDYKNAEATSIRIKQADVGGKASERAGVIHAASIFKAANAQKESGDKRAAAFEYRRAALDVPDFENADQSLYNSALEFMAVQEWNEAIVSYQLLVHRYLSSDLITQSYYNMGVIYRDELNDQLSAAGVFDTLAFEHKGSKYDRTALSQASYNYEQAGEWANTIRINLEYVKRFPKEEDTQQYLFETAGLYLKLNDEASAIKVYEDFSRKFPNDIRVVQANFEQGEYYLEKGDKVRARQKFENTIESHKHLLKTQNKGYPEYASKALAQITEWKFLEFMAIEYKNPKAKKEASRKKKEAMRKELLESYRELINLAKKESFQAYFRIAQLDEAIAYAQATQDPDPIEDELKIIQIKRDIADEAMAFFNGARDRFIESITELEKARIVLNETRNKVTAKYDSLNSALSVMQKSSIDPALSTEEKDSLSTQVVNTQEELSKTSNQLDEIKESIDLIVAYQDSGRYRIPNLVLENANLQFYRFRALLETPDEGARRLDKMFYRDQVLRSFIIPEIPLTIEPYLWVIESADTSVVGTSIADTARTLILQVADTVLAEFKKRIDYVDESGYSFYQSRYEILLAQEDEDARAYGLYVDEMPDEIISFQELMLNFNTGLQLAMTTLIEAAMADQKASDDYYEQLFERSIRAGVDYVTRFEELRDQAIERKAWHQKKLERTMFALEQDAVFNYDGFALTWNDYILELLNVSWETPDIYQIKPQPVTNEMIRKLVTYAPAQYAYLIGLKEELHKVVTDESWRVSTVAVEGFELPDFDDSTYMPVMLTSFPDSLDAIYNPDANPVPVGYYTMKSVVIMVDTLVKDPDYVPDSLRVTEPEIDSLESHIQPENMQVEPDSTEPELDSPDDSIELLEEAPQLQEGEPEEETGDETGEEVVPEDTTQTQEEDIHSFLMGLPDLTPEGWDALEYALAMQPVDSDTMFDTDVINDVEMVQYETESMEIDTTDDRIPEGYMLQQVEREVEQREGYESLFYRYEFETADRITFAEVEITADDDWIIWVNGELVDEDYPSDGDWKDITFVNITEFLERGPNLIAIQVNDPNKTGGGLWLRLTYSTIPDIPDDLTELLNKLDEGNSTDSVEEIQDSGNENQLEENEADYSDPENNE